MKVINPEGEAALLEAARSVAGDRLPWLEADDVSEVLEKALDKALKEAIAGGLRGAAETFAEEIVAWVMQSEVFFDHCTDDDIILEIQSEGDGLFTVTVLDMLLLEVEIMDNADVVDGTELSSREFIRQRITKTLRAMADRVEQYKPDDGP